MTTRTELRITRICAEILGLDSVKVGDDLYTLGCDSQDIVRIALAIEEEFAIDLPLETMEQSGDVSQIATWVDKQMSALRTE